MATAGKGNSESRSSRAEQQSSRLRAVRNLCRRGAKCSLSRYREQAHADEEEGEDEQYERGNRVSKVWDCPQRGRSGNRTDRWPVTLPAELTGRECRGTADRRSAVVPVLLLCAARSPRVVAHRFLQGTARLRTPFTYRANLPPSAFEMPP